MNEEHPSAVTSRVANPNEQVAEARDFAHRLYRLQLAARAFAEVGEAVAFSLVLPHVRKFVAEGKKSDEKWAGAVVGKRCRDALFDVELLALALAFEDRSGLLDVRPADGDGAPLLVALVPTVEEYEEAIAIAAAAKRVHLANLKLDARARVLGADRAKPALVEMTCAACGKGTLVRVVGKLAAGAQVQCATCGQIGEPKATRGVGGNRRRRRANAGRS